MVVEDGERPEAIATDDGEPGGGMVCRYGLGGCLAGQPKGAGIAGQEGFAIEGEGCGRICWLEFRGIEAEGVAAGEVGALGDMGFEDAVGVAHGLVFE